MTAEFSAKIGVDWTATHYDEPFRPGMTPQNVKIDMQLLLPDHRCVTLV